MSLQSWGNNPKALNQKIHIPFWKSDPLPSDRPLLPYGLGRSYGDCCLNHGGTLIHTKLIDRLISFDRDSGIIECEAGLSFAALLRFIVPHGWFLPVTPGTRFVTVGGAIANDVHGKNHHVEGTFGRHVSEMTLVRSDRGAVRISRDLDPELFAATIGGIGLTGLITSAKFNLKRIVSSSIDCETIKFTCIDEFESISTESDSTHEYTVAWIDSTARGRQLGRGHFIRGNHASVGALVAGREKPLVTIPFDFPEFFLNGMSIRIGNFGYYHRMLKNVERKIVDYNSFFYPLDAIGSWNRIYGMRGMYQYQCALPANGGLEAVKDMLDSGMKLGAGSFLSVLKKFGSIRSPGMISFPRPGYTLALDFPFEGASSRNLINRLDAINRAAGGAIYTAKDSGSAPDLFFTSYPRLGEFEKHIDPAFSSSLWRRFTQRRRR